MGTLEPASDRNSFHTFNPSDHVERGRHHHHVQKSDLFPKSRSNCHHPICSWWRWRGKEEEFQPGEKIQGEEVIVLVGQPASKLANLHLPGCSRDSFAFSLMILARRAF